MTPEYSQWSKHCDDVGHTKVSAGGTATYSQKANSRYIECSVIGCNWSYTPQSLIKTTSLTGYGELPQEKEGLDMTVQIRGNNYIITLTKKEIDEIRYAVPSKISELIAEAEKADDKFATNDMFVKSTSNP